MSFYNVLVEILWVYGITFCGPVRSILVFEQSPSVLFAAVMVFLGSSSTAKTRGLWSLVLGFLVLLFMDADGTVELNHGECGKSGLQPLPQPRPKSTRAV